MDKVSFVSGKTRLFGIVGHPIEQVRSPEMITAELHKRGQDAVLVPIHVLPECFDATLPAVMKIHNLGGLVFTVPYKARAVALADELGPHARAVGAINALTRRADGRWHGEIFDGIGCVEAFRRRDFGFAGRGVMLIGAGGAGAAIGVAIASERPRSMRLFDIDGARAGQLADRIRQIDPGIEVAVGSPTCEGIDVLLNASPVGMLEDSRMPIEADRFPASLIVFDAIVKPEKTPLLRLADESGCRTVYGREMMHGQISKIVDFFRHS